MKRKRNKDSSSFQEEEDVYLPDECWECISKFLINHNADDNHGRYFHLKSLSAVSKQLLSVTNRIRTSLTIYRPTQKLFSFSRRFTNISSLNLSSYRGDINSILLQISLFSFNITSLNLSNQLQIPVIGLREFSKNITALTSLISSNIATLYTTDMLLIAECFPMLQQLDLSNSRQFVDNTYPHTPSLSSKLSKLRKLNLSHDTSLIFCRTGHNHSYGVIIYLLSMCPCIQHLSLENANAYSLNDQNIADLSLLLGNLVSINLSGCTMLTQSSLFALVSKCSSLIEIKMERTSIGKKSVEISNSLMDRIANSRLKSLYLAYCQELRDETIILFSSIFPNLQLLDLNSCQLISDKGIGQVLRTFYDIRYLNLARCSRGKLLEGINFQVFKLEVLNLSHTRVNDETLYAISKGCVGLFQLNLEGCDCVTEKGVKHVVENCTQLREIDLRHCHQVQDNISSILLSSPSLRKIIVSPCFWLDERKMKLLSLVS